MGSITPSEAPIRFAIFECQPLFGETQSRYGTIGGLFDALFLQNPKAGPIEQVTVTKYVVDQDDTEYPDLNEIDAMLITGSLASAYMDIPWINKLCSFTAAALETPHIRVMGVCFGHQLMARAMGLEVSVNRMGWEAATLPIDLTPTGKALFGKDQLILPLLHQDIVPFCPSDVHNLGWTARCAVQGLFKPGKYFSIQAHPEITQDVLREILVKMHAEGLYDQAIFDEGMESVDLDHDGLLVGRAFWRFLLADRY